MNNMYSSDKPSGFSPVVKKEEELKHIVEQQQRTIDQMSSLIESNDKRTEQLIKQLNTQIQEQKRKFDKNKSDAKFDSNKMKEEIDVLHEHLGRMGIIK